MNTTQRIAHIARKTNTPRNIIANLITLGSIYAGGGPAAQDARNAYDRIVCNCCGGVDPLS